MALWVIIRVQAPGRANRNCNQGEIRTTVVTTKFTDDAGRVVTSTEVQLIPTVSDCVPNPKRVDVEVTDKQTGDKTKITVQAPPAGAAPSAAGKNARSISIPEDALPPSDSDIHAITVLESSKGTEYVVEAPRVTRSAHSRDTLWCENVRYVQVRDGVLGAPKYYVPPGGICPLRSPFSEGCDAALIEKLRLLHEGDYVGTNFTGECGLISWPNE
jgi:hypothetical protein